MLIWVDARIRKNKTCWTVRQKQQSHEGENTFWDCRFFRDSYFSFYFVSFTGEAVFCSKYEISPMKTWAITEFLVPKIVSLAETLGFTIFSFDFLPWLGLLWFFPPKMSFQGPPILGPLIRFFQRALDFDLFRRIKRNPLRGGRWRDSGAVAFCDLGWPWLEMGKFRFPGFLVPKSHGLCTL